MFDSGIAWCWETIRIERNWFISKVVNFQLHLCQLHKARVSASRLQPDPLRSSGRVRQLCRDPPSRLVLQSPHAHTAASILLACVARIYRVALANERSWCPPHKRLRVRAWCLLTITFTPNWSFAWPHRRQKEPSRDSLRTESLLLESTTLEQQQPWPIELIVR